MDTFILAVGFNLAVPDFCSDLEMLEEQVNRGERGRGSYLACFGLIDVRSDIRGDLITGNMAISHTCTETSIYFAMMD